HQAPNGAASCVGIALYFPRAARLKAGSSYPVRLKSPYYRQKWSLAFQLTPIS
ncbi:hypothetical protein BgiBS90_002170, partial [Biomphalaria glabrata]